MEAWGIIPASAAKNSALPMERREKGDERGVMALNWRWPLTRQRWSDGRTFGVKRQPQEAAASIAESALAAWQGPYEGDDPDKRADGEATVGGGKRSEGYLCRGEKDDPEQNK
ncbi:hypothetical protein IGS68_10265 [Skermanella sp. TT6]|uniref:Uncharacterized protein n=1 Tax=Skermanella cutis TaxID=2775420 RepID=A0ABX7BFW6_9PROT|nr:hypothetical protein [Skermanella sp. TT6]QQP92660.1 hypothetical protein IGS68_10265 [Skermanella sp. TT6]